MILGTPGPEVIELCSCSTQLSMKFILFINVMPTIVGILTFISSIKQKSYFSIILHFMSNLIFMLS